MDAIEQVLWDAFDSGRSIGARNALVEYYLPQVRRLAQHVMARMPRDQGGLEVDDLVSDAVFGLVTSIERFDRSRGLQFMTLAAQRIRGAIGDGFRERDWATRRQRQREKSGQSEPLRVISLDAMHDLLHVRTQDMDREDGVEKSEEDFNGNVDAARRLHFEESQDRSDWWRVACRGLNKQERLILIAYFRLSQTMAQVGAGLGISESRVSQIMKQILERLRERPQLVESL